MNKKPLHLRNGYKDPKRMSAIHQIGCSACIRNNLAQQYPTEAHHLIGYGLGLKPSDLISISLCDLHHYGRFLKKGENRTGNSIHETPLKRWQQTFGSQEELYALTNKILGAENLTKEVLGVEPLGEVELTNELLTTN